MTSSSLAQLLDHRQRSAYEPLVTRSTPSNYSVVLDIGPERARPCARWASSCSSFICATVLHTFVLKWEPVFLS